VVETTLQYVAGVGMGMDQIYVFRTISMRPAGQILDARQMTNPTLRPDVDLPTVCLFVVSVVLR
jgi:hypothetical protein